MKRRFVEAGGGRIVHKTWGLSAKDSHLFAYVNGSLIEV
jgi:hypothetical protein